MKPHWQYALCGACLLCATSYGQVAKQETPSSGQAVQIYLTAADRHESPIKPDLSQLSFSLDNQAVQAISLRSADEDTLLFAVLVDMSGSQAKEAALLKETASQLFRDLLNGRNVGRLVVFNDQVAVSSAPPRLSELQSALDTLQFLGETVLYDAIAVTCTKVLSRAGNPRTPRRAIFLITDGLDDRSTMNEARAEEIAEDEGVAVFSLQVIGEGMNGAETRRATHFLQKIASDTGGAFFHPKRPEQGVSLLLNAVHRQWALGVLPSQPPDQKQHSFAVKSAEKDVRVSAPVKISLQVM